jgi:3-dehydroquinate synthase
VGREARATARSRKAALITDANVAAHYLDAAEGSLRAAGMTVEAIILPPGEQTKTLAQAGLLFDTLLAAGMDRGSVVVAVGGGVVTDIAGFVAATYMRGIPWVAVATTLLAQVDASVGGKTAVDHPQCKNLIGAFHQPAAVLIDVDTLATLPEEEFRTGLAEVIKHGVIRDASLFEAVEQRADAILARDGDVLVDIVTRNVAIKAEVVTADEREAGLRRILNYGHTIGHAIESLALESPAPADSPPMTHGRAVALGMVAEAEIAVRRGLAPRAVAARQKQLLARFGLPVQLDRGMDLDRILSLMQHDKKAESGRLRFVVPVSVGATRELDNVTDAEIREAVRSLGG